MAVRYVLSVYFSQLCVFLRECDLTIYSGIVHLLIATKNFSALKKKHELSSAVHHPIKPMLLKIYTAAGSMVPFTD